MFGACIPIVGVARRADDQASCSLKVHCLCAYYRVHAACSALGTAGRS